MIHLLYTKKFIKATETEYNTLPLIKHGGVSLLNLSEFLIFYRIHKFLQNLQCGYGNYSKVKTRFDAISERQKYNIMRWNHVIKIVESLENVILFSVV